MFALCVIQARCVILKTTPDVIAAQHGAGRFSSSQIESPSKRLHSTHRGAALKTCDYYCRKLNRPTSVHILQCKRQPVFAMVIASRIVPRAVASHNLRCVTRGRSLDDSIRDGHRVLRRPTSGCVLHVATYKTDSIV